MFYSPCCSKSSRSKEKRKSGENATAHDISSSQKQPSTDAQYDATSKRSSLEEYMLQGKSFSEDGELRSSRVGREKKRAKSRVTIRSHFQPPRKSSSGVIPQVSPALSGDLSPRPATARATTSMENEPQDEPAGKVREIELSAPFLQVGEDATTLDSTKVFPTSSTIPRNTDSQSGEQEQRGDDNALEDGNANSPTLWSEDKNIPADEQKEAALSAQQTETENEPTMDATATEKGMNRQTEEAASFDTKQGCCHAKPHAFIHIH